MADFYPEVRGGAFPDTCRCSQCHEHFNGYEWYLEIVKAHYRIYHGDEEYILGRWLFTLINTVLNQLHLADNTRLIPQPPDPFATLRKQVILRERVKPIKTPSQSKNYRKIQESRSCHYCHKYCCNMFRCSEPDCGLLYCGQLLQQNHSGTYHDFDADEHLFVCPRCRGICICTKCNFIAALDKLLEEEKTMKQWLLYYLVRLHLFGEDRVLYTVLRNVMISSKTIQKIAHNIVNLFAPPIE
jgi:hypothetical protein